MGATIREHNGSWHVFVHHSGQRAHIDFPSKKAAETARTLIAAKLLGAQITGAVKPSPQAVLAGVAPVSATIAATIAATTTALTFQDYVEKTYLPKVEHELKPSTYGDYDSALNVHLLPELGDLPLSEITRRRIKALTARLRTKGLRAKTVRKIVNVLSVILSEAFEDELITAHPAEKMKRHYRSSDLRGGQDADHATGSCRGRCDLRDGAHAHDHAQGKDRTAVRGAP